MSTRSGASYTAGGSGTNSPTPPVDAAEVLDDPSLQHPLNNTNQPALLEVGGGPPDLAGRGDHLGPGQETPERGQALPRDPDPVDPTPTPPRTQDDGVGRPTSSPDTGASLHEASGAPLSGTGARPREGAHPTTYHHTPANATSCRAPAGAAFSGDDVTGAAGSSRFPASHPTGYTTQGFASHPPHNNNPWFEGSSVRHRPYHSDYNRLDLGDKNNELQMNRMISSVSINDPNLTNDMRRLSDRPIPHYNYYDRQVGRGGTGTGGGQRDSGTLPLSPDLQRLVEDKYKETLLIFNESLAKYEGGEGGISPALLPGINFHINHLSDHIQSTLNQVREYREQRGGEGRLSPKIVRQNVSKPF